MIFIGILIGIFLVVALIAGGMFYAYRTMNDPKRSMRLVNPDRGTLDDLNQAAAALFPQSAARSYVQAEVPLGHVDLFIRSHGKRAGVHSFVLEVRLPRGRDVEMEKILSLLSKNGMEMTRKDKARGLIKLESAKTNDLDALFVQCRAICEELGTKPETDKYIIRWHDSAKPTRRKGTSKSPESGETVGGYPIYERKVRTLAEDQELQQFFVTCGEKGGEKLVQMSAGRGKTKEWSFQFDIPVRSWSEPYIPAVRAHAEAKGYEPYDSAGPSKKKDKFFDIDFDDADELLAFTKEVMGEVLDMDVDGKFEITWG